MDKTIDVDLDVYNALKGFPQDEDNAVIYIRIQADADKKGTKNTALITGYNTTLILALVNAMNSNSGFAEAVEVALEVYKEGEDEDK